MALDAHVQHVPRLCGVPAYDDPYGATACGGTFAQFDDCCVALVRDVIRVLPLRPLI